MSATITKDDVLYVAALAKIAITPAQAVHFTKELTAILEYIKQIDAVDTDGLEPTYQVTGLANVIRKDEPWDYGVDQAGLLKNTRDTKDGHIKVPRVL